MHRTPRGRSGSILNIIGAAAVICDVSCHCAQFMRFPTFLARQKYRFDIGQGFLAVVNFAFVVLAASDKITTLVHVPAKFLVPLLVPSAVLFVWLLGFILDKMQFMQAYQEEQNRRNEMLSAVHSSISSPVTEKKGSP